MIDSNIRHGYTVTIDNSEVIMDFMEGWVTTGDAVSISGYSRLTLYTKWLKGEIRREKVGNTVLYNQAEMERLAGEREEKRKKEEGKE